MSRFAGTVRGVLPRELSQLLLLLGSTFLLIAPRLRWEYGAFNYIDSGHVAGARTAVILGFLAMEFSGAVGYLMCLLPFRRPARGLLLGVCAPGLGGLGLWTGAYLYLRAEPGPLLGATNYSTGILDPLLSAGRNLGPGFNFALAGLALVLIFTVVVAVGSGSLPLALEPSAPWLRDEAFRSRGLDLAVWGAVVWVPFAWGAGLGLIGALRIHGFRNLLLLHRQLIPAFTSFFLNGMACLLFIGFAVCVAGTNVWKFLRRSLRLPLPEFLVLAAALPAAISVAASVAEFLVLRSVGVASAEAARPLSYFTMPSVGVVFSAVLLAFFEEAIFRGILQPALLRRYGAFAGIFFVGVIWAGGHFWDDATPKLTGAGMLWDIVWRLAWCVVLSAVLGWLTLRTRSIIPATVTHGVYNSLIPTFHVAGLGTLNFLLWCAVAYGLFRLWPISTQDPEQDDASAASHAPAIT